MLSKGKFANTSKHSVYGPVNTEKVVETQTRKHKTVCFPTAGLLLSTYIKAPANTA